MDSLQFLHMEIRQIEDAIAVLELNRTIRPNDSKNEALLAGYQIKLIKKISELERFNKKVIA